MCGGDGWKRMCGWVVDLFVNSQLMWNFTAVIFNSAPLIS